MTCWAHLIMAETDHHLDAWGYAIVASDTLRPGPYRGVVYYDPVRPKKYYDHPGHLGPTGPGPSPVHGKCQCGSGSDDLGPGHSDWCPRHVQ